LSNHQLTSGRGRPVFVRAKQKTENEIHQLQITGKNETQIISAMEL
jgi:hypothetical protein